MRTAGLVLAGGASRRMGEPKALLPTPEGVPLAARQAQVLREGGCDPVAVVVGAGAEAVRAALPGGLATIENARWALGRATSLQAGIEAFPEADAYLFLPVDAAGIATETIRVILSAVAAAPEQIWRPVYHGRKGHMLWIPRALAADVVRLPPEARVDEWVRPLARPIEVEDPALLHNINTPEEWTRLMGERGSME